MVEMQVNHPVDTSETLLQVCHTLKKWAIEGPPRNPRAAAQALAEELEALAPSSSSSSAFEASLHAGSLSKEVDRLTALIADLQQKNLDREADLQDFRHLSLEREAMLSADRDASRLQRPANDPLESQQLRLQASAHKEELSQLMRRVESLSLHLNSVLTPVSAVCRTRPVESYKDTAGNITSRSSLSIDGSEIAVEDVSGRSRKFKVDRVLDGSASQEDVFLTAAPWVEHAALGGTSCVFAYGATGSGKTHSILGDGPGSCPGLAHHALRRLIEGPGGGEVRLSMLEVYCEQIRDLLAPAEASGQPTLQCSRRDGQGRMLLDAVEVTARTSTEAEAALLRGFANRVTEGTLCNERSSRSHVVLTVQVTAPQDKLANNALHGRLVLVDLAGSENVQRSGADEGGKLLMEAKAINRSLSALADVVEATAKQQSFVPYRNSRLTMLLEEALTASKVLLLVHVSPCTRDATDTAHSLQFASRVRAVDFGAQRLRQDQEERARAAQLRSQQEVRQLQSQLDQTKRELAESQKAVQELKQQQSNIAEQLRERQRDLIREQELRSKAEETLREYRQSTPIRTVSTSFITSSLAVGGGIISPAGSCNSSSRLQPPKSTALNRSSSMQSQLAAKSRLEHRSCENEPLELTVQTTAPRAPLCDRTNADTKGLTLGLKEVCSFDKNAPTSSPHKLQLEESHNQTTLETPTRTPATLSEINGRCSMPEQASTITRSPFKVCIDTNVALPCSQSACSTEKQNVTVAESEARQVRSCLRQTPSDFRGRQLRRQEFGPAAVSSRRVHFSEDECTASSPPRWYLELLEYDLAIRQQEIRNLVANVIPTSSVQRSPTPPARRRKEVPRESRDNSLGRWR